MKRLVSSLLVLSSLSAFGQGMNEAVDNLSRTVNEQYLQLKMADLPKQLDTLLYKASSVKVERNEKLAGLLMCVRKQIRSNNPYVDRSNLENIISSVLENGVLTSDETKLVSADLACRQERELTHTSDEVSLAKAQVIVEAMIKPAFACRSKSSDASLSVGIGAGLGGTLFECQGSDGSVRLYAGPKFIASAGVGADVSTEYETEWDNRDLIVRKGTIFPVQKGTDFKYGVFKIHHFDKKGNGYGVGVNVDAHISLTARVGARRSNFDVLQKFLETSF